MKGFSCSAISSSSFPSSLSVPVFSSSVALSQKSPYCSYKWHTRVITPSYRQDKKRRSVLLSAILCDAAIHLVPPSSRPLVSSGRGVFHLIVPSRPPSCSLIRIISSSRLVPRVVEAGRGGVSFLCLVFCLMPCRLISSVRGKQSKTGREVLGFVSPFYLIRVRAERFISMPSSSRSSSRSIVSLCVSPRLVPSRVISSDEWQASKEAGRLGFGFVSLFCLVRRASSVPSPVLMAFPSCPSSPRPRHHQQASKTARGNKTRARREAAGSGGGMAVSTIASLDRIPAGK